MSITHAKVSAVADGADASLVRPSDWNAVHVGDFNGGTITDALDISTTNAALHRLYIGNSDDPAATLYIDSSGRVVLTAADNPLSIVTDGTETLRADTDGKLRVMPSTNGSSAQPALAVDAAAAISTLLRLKSGTTNVLTVDKAGNVVVSGNSGGSFTVANNGSTQAILTAGAYLSVLDDAFALLFQVRYDGSVHIKTGTSIIADL